MSERFTKKDAERALQLLCKELGREYGWTWRRGSDAEGNPRNIAGPIGAWALDYNPAYGGCTVAELHNEGGGEGRPLGEIRRSPREFVEAIHFARRVLEQARQTV